MTSADFTSLYEAVAESTVYCLFGGYSIQILIRTSLSENYCQILCTDLFWYVVTLLSMAQYISIQKLKATIKLKCKQNSLDVHYISLTFLWFLYFFYIFNILIFLVYVLIKIFNLIEIQSIGNLFWTDSEQLKENSIK